MKEIPVTFKSHDKQIVGMLHLPNRKNAPVIIMCHGYGGNKLGNHRKTYVKTARYFAKNGVAAFRFDFMGCGDSEGNFDELTVTKQIKNLQDAISFIESFWSIDRKRIGAMGWSRGSAICILTATRDNRIKCVVSWAGEASFDATWSKAQLLEIKKKGHYTFYWPETVITAKMYKDELKYNILKSLKKIKIPFLVVQGTRDDSVPLSQGELLYKVANKPKKIFVVKGDDHSFSGFEEKVMKETLSWFKKWLK